MDKMVSPFHADELAAQNLAGAGASGGAIRAFMPDQHREFFELLPYLFAGTAGADGWPLATMLTGEPGFVHSPDSMTLRIDVAPAHGDPAASGFAPGKEIGILGVDFSTRRRNRANGRISELSSDGLTVAVRQSFGNCAKYIQKRSVRTELASPGPVEELRALDPEARSLIGSADTFFVASRSRTEIDPADGHDMSHRGGRPGFVKVEGDRLFIPDFSGNRYYNTLGNLLGEPRSSLLFIDFERGDLLQLQGLAEIDWEGRVARNVEGAERSWTFRTVRGWRRRGAIPLRWSLEEFSPFTEKTGVWG
jgi:uncharacterized protein